MAKKAVINIIIFGIIGLIIGYFIYAKVAGEYLDPLKLVMPAKNGLHELGRKVSGISDIRNKIFLFGGIGAGVGLVLTILKKK